MRFLVLLFSAVFGVRLVSSACTYGPSDRQCWDGDYGTYNITTDYYKDTPNTGRVVEYWLEVTNVTMAPDGVLRPVVAFNNSIPGPLLECNWGDTMVVHVKNNLQYNGTSVHWHGILMEGNVANDGVPGLTQCPIPPGGSFTYTWRATSYGPTWYHSHFSLQYSNGAFGPLVIHGPSSTNWDIDLGPLAVGDWYHEPAFEAYYGMRMDPTEPPNALFNGLNTWNASGKIVGQKYETTATPGKKHRLRIINMSTDSHFKFSIDQHVMTVHSADFVAIEPYNTTTLNIFIGQRYDIVINADQPIANYYMRLTPSSGCSNITNPDLTAILHYDGADNSLPTSTPYIPPNMVCEDETGLVPIVERNAGPFSFSTGMDITIDEAMLASEGIFSWNVNGTSFKIDWDDPTLLKVENHDNSYPADYNVVELNGTSSTWVYVVIQSSGKFALNHPIHMHGHDYMLLGTGNGTFNASKDFSSLQLNNPPRRDVITLPKSDTGEPTGGWAVIGFALDNPGVWIIHCHIAWHVSEGLAMQFVERYSEIAGHVGVTQQWTDNCKAWQAYQTTFKPLQEDSGV